MMEEMFYLVFPKIETGLQDAFRYRVKNLSKGIYLESGELAGFTLCDVYGDNFEMIKINYIVVHPAFQKNGFGSILLETILHICRKMSKKVTLVPVMKTHIIEWYRKKGFKITRIAKATDGGKLYEMTYVK
jgi:ribosomal protein S18 acetylase RimI-like enzyme